MQKDHDYIVKVGYLFSSFGLYYPAVFVLGSKNIQRKALAVVKAESIFLALLLPQYLVVLSQHIHKNSSHLAALGKIALNGGDTAYDLGNAFFDDVSLFLEDIPQRLVMGSLSHSHKVCEVLSLSAFLSRGDTSASEYCQQV